MRRAARDLRQRRRRGLRTSAPFRPASPPPLPPRRTRRAVRMPTMCRSWARPLGWVSSPARQSTAHPSRPGCTEPAGSRPRPRCRRTLQAAPCRSSSGTRACVRSRDRPSGRRARRSAYAGMRQAAPPPRASRRARSTPRRTQARCAARAARCTRQPTTHTHTHTCTRARTRARTRLASLYAMAPTMDLYCGASRAAACTAAVEASHCASTARRKLGRSRRPTRARGATSGEQTAALAVRARACVRVCVRVRAREGVCARACERECVCACAWMIGR
jgi:hypothetical protein